MKESKHRCFNKCSAKKMLWSANRTPKECFYCGNLTDCGNQTHYTDKTQYNTHFHRRDERDRYEED